MVDRTQRGAVTPKPQSEGTRSATPGKQIAEQAKPPPMKKGWVEARTGARPEITQAAKAAAARQMAGIAAGVESTRRLFDNVNSRVGAGVFGAEHGATVVAQQVVTTFRAGFTFDGPGSAGNAGWLKKVPPPTVDGTPRFLALNAAAKAGKNTLPPDAKNYTYLMVGGLFTDHYRGYMTGNLKSLKDAGLDARKVAIDTDKDVETNAKVIRDAILEASKNGKQVVLSGQSKGGVDIAAAMALYPELKAHVRAVVSMQAPYGGTPIASDIANCRQLREVASTVITRLLDGDPRALTDLSYKVRQEFVAAHPYPSDVPTVSLATSRNSHTSLLKSTEDYLLHRYGLKSDGLVVDVDAEIPGSTVVRLEDMDHTQSVMAAAPGMRTYDPGDVTTALVAQALELATQRDRKKAPPARADGA
jgi:triacylglycerol lipase